MPENGERRTVAVCSAGELVVGATAVVVGAGSEVVVVVGSAAVVVIPMVEVVRSVVVGGSEA
jgi:hypothetical protein